MKKQMMYISTQWNGKPSFRLMPIDSACPYMEALFVPQQKILVVITKDIKSEFKFIPRVDDFGQPVIKGGTGINGVAPQYKEDRMLLDINAEFSFTVKEEMEEFLTMVVGELPKSWEDYFKEEEAQLLKEPVSLKILDKDGQ